MKHPIEEAPAFERALDVRQAPRAVRGVIAFLLVVPSLACGGRAPLPDVLLVSLDTLRADRLSCYGYERATSPHLDRIAREGVRFASVQAAASNTQPSHMSVFTGLDPDTHGIQPQLAWRGGSPRTLSPDVATLPEILRESGYRTGSFTDSGGLPPEAGFGRGFDCVRTTQVSPKDKLALVSDWLAEGTRERPVFALFHTYAIHSPYITPDPYYGMWSDAAYQGRLRKRVEVWRRLKLDLVEEGEEAPLPEKFLGTWEGMTDADLRFMSDIYDEGVTYADSILNDLLDTWALQRDLAQTLIVVFSDHGEEFMERGRFGHVDGLHRELVGVPLVLRGPGVGRGVATAPVSLTDLAPTLLELLDLPGPPMQGSSLAHLVREPAGEHAAEPIFSQDRRLESMCETVFHRGLRLIRTEFGEHVQLELYDWNEDPGELVDLSAERPNDVRRLVELLDRRRDEMDALKKSVREGQNRIVGAEEAARLEALGYTSDEEPAQPRGDAREGAE